MGDKEILGDSLKISSEDEKKAVEDAKEFFNLTVKQDVKGIEESVEKLKELVDKYPKKEEIALYYAMGLFNLTFEQDVKGIEESVEKLKKIVEKYPENEEIAVQYAKGLVNLSSEEDLKGIEESVEKLKELVDKYPKNEEIEFQYAKGLVNLSSEEDLKGIEESVEKLKELVDKYPKNEEIAVQYAKGLFNLTFEQDLKGIEESVEKLKEYRENNFKKNKDINILYIKSILNLIDLTKKVDLNKVLEKIDKEITEEDIINFSSTEIEDVIDFSMKTKNTYMFISKLLFLFKEKLQDTRYEFFIKILDSYESNNKHFENMSNLYIITKKIMYDLCLKEFKQLKLAHYSNVETIPFLIKPKKEKDIVKLRLNNASYMNDPLEGSILLKYLRQEIRDNNFLKEILSEFESDFEDIPKVSSVYLFSLTQSIDKLPMWSEYGNKGNGVCLTFGNSFFSLLDQYEQNIKYKDSCEINSEEEKSKSKERFCPYKICYINSKNGNLTLDKNIKKHIEEMKNTIKAIGDDLEGENDDLKQLIKEDIKECLEQIRYLFKSSDYEHEKEVRLLKYVDLSSDKIKLNEDKKPVPWLYIERDDGVGLEFTEVILGPKVENVGYIAPYIKYCDEKIVVKKSEIKYR